MKLMNFIISHHENTTVFKKQKTNTNTKTKTKTKVKQKKELSQKTIQTY